MWTLPFRVSVTNFAIHATNQAQFERFPGQLQPQFSLLFITFSRLLVFDLQLLRLPPWQEECAPCELRPIYNVRFEGLCRLDTAQQQFAPRDPEERENGECVESPKQFTIYTR